MVKQVKFALILVLLLEAVLVCVAHTIPSTASEFDDLEPQLGEKLGPSRPNRISKGMRYLLRSSSRSLLSRQPSSVSDKDLGESPKSSVEEQQNYDGMDSEKLLVTSLCPVSQQALCEKAIHKAMLSRPQTMEDFAETIRRKPGHVSAGRLAALKLFAKMIAKVESKGYDDKLDKAINVAAARNPYAFAVNTAINKMV